MRPCKMYNNCVLCYLHIHNIIGNSLLRSLQLATTATDDPILRPQEGYYKFQVVAKYFVFFLQQCIG